jgi:threonine synthase
MPAKIDKASVNHIYANCLDCGHRMVYSPTLMTCPVCNSQWMEASYNYFEIATHLPGLLATRPFNLWRYRELLPNQAYNPILSMGEGGTPLIRAINLGMMLGCPNIFFKDERQGPTASFKDRQAAVNISALKEAGIKEVVLASTGNVALAYSAYAARAGIRLWAFLTSLVPDEKMREVALYGTQVVKVTSSYDETKKLAEEFARQRGLYLERGPRSIPSVEAMKTIAFEICEQLSEIGIHPGNGTESSIGRENSGESVARGRFRAPDWYIQAVSGGLGPLGVQKGFRELHQMALIDHLPAFAGVQSEGCSPMVNAWRQDRETAEPVVSPLTHITTLSTGDPGRSYTLLRQRMKAGNDGSFESVSDEEAFRAMHILAKMEGISVEPAAAVAFAGLIKLIRKGIIRNEELIVVNCTGHTMPIEPVILGDRCAQNLVLTSPCSETPQEGLLGALSKVTDDRYPHVLVVDDREDARRLIRRILQAQGNYTISEAENGQLAIDVARRELPDLVILDLMMPEVDGFDVLDALKADPNTAPIPVIVVTAKELTPDEKRRVDGQISIIMQKGEFMSDELLEEVKVLIE